MQCVIYICRSYFDRDITTFPDPFKVGLLDTNQPGDSSLEIDRGDTWEEDNMPRNSLKKRRKSGTISYNSTSSPSAADTRAKSSPLDVDFREVDRVNMSFAGCGFLGIYHLGVAKTLICNGPRFLERVDSFGGASAGSLIACIFAMDGGKEVKMKFIEVRKCLNDYTENNSCLVLGFTDEP